jgi:hypothetical protein
VYARTILAGQFRFGRRVGALAGRQNNGFAWLAARVQRSAGYRFHGMVHVVDKIKTDL